MTTIQAGFYVLHVSGDDSMTPAYRARSGGSRLPQGNASRIPVGADGQQDKES